MRPLLTPAAGALLLGTASAVVWTYGRTQVVADGASPGASTVAWMALGVGGTATFLTVRALSRLRPQTAWLLSGASTAAAIGVLGVGAGRLPVALAACAVFGWGFVAASSALIAWATLLVPEHAAAGTSALFITLVLGQAAGSAAAGGIVEHRTLTQAFVLAAGLAVVAAGCGSTGLRRSGGARSTTASPRPARPTA